MNKTPISILQELMVKKNILPSYLECPSDNERFSFACIVHAGSIEVKGYGNNKKEAKQNSASNALESLNYSINDEYMVKSIQTVSTSLPAQSSSISIGNQNSPPDNYVGKLNEYCSTHGKPYPQYQDNIVPLNGRFIVHCHFSKFVTDGLGLNKKTAKQESAKKMLELLKDENVEDDIDLIDNVSSSLKDDKKENINKLSEAMLKKYEEMSINDKGITLTPTFDPMPFLNEDDVISLEQLQNGLRKSGYEVVVRAFQRNPHIMMLKIEGTQCVMMGHGDSEKEAREDLLKGASVMFRNGFSFKNRF
ncbi:unnamed protein product [Phaedon cochleariae]|uniref:DRBM domain-containing protein n=1 Tax=Phaedon cochleariae TaxID=80249 RepID=A0A9P0GU86_PHACE|nr:unnamed protein product [Phaedon cochleariae]